MSESSVDGGDTASQGQSQLGQRARRVGPGALCEARTSEGASQNPIWNVNLDYNSFSVDICWLIRRTSPNSISRSQFLTDFFLSTTSSPAASSLARHAYGQPIRIYHPRFLRQLPPRRISPGRCTQGPPLQTGNSTRGRLCNSVHRHPRVSRCCYY